MFDKNKGAIFALYNRALRNDPSLEGKLVLRLTIAPNGSVTFCEVVSSELNDVELERKLVQRVKLFRFEAKDVEPITTTKPIDFFQRNGGHLIACERGDVRIRSKAQRSSHEDMDVPRFAGISVFVSSPQINPRFATYAV